MARVGEVITNPGTGERIEFLRTRETTDGARLELELTLAPKGRVGGLPHQHPATETVEVLEGVLSGRIRARRVDVTPGGRIVLPAGVGHYLFNDTEEPVRARVTATPALDFETFFETVFALAHERREHSFRGLPAPLHAAMLSRVYDVYAPVMPIAVQRRMLDPVVLLAQKRGYPVKVAPVEEAAGAEGLEPPTYGFGDRRSTN
jgi:quercetin dioxygenase-like cupin family protein